MTIEEDWDPAPALDAPAILEVLHRHEVRFVVIGGMAAQLQGGGYPTLDIDITPALDRANLANLASALKDMDARLRAEGLPPGGMRIALDARTFAHVSTITFATALGPLDVALHPDGTDGYADLVRGAVSVEYGGRTAWVAHLRDVIRSKRAAGRPKDVEQIPDLRRRLAEIENSESGSS
ncbi:MAG: hypothetical protein NVS3B24_02120 [Candidatus Dormibacteria bacterium]